MAVVDPVIGVDDFNRPKVLSERESYITDLLIMLFTVPGQYPAIPRFGMNIQSYLYQFEDTIDPIKIKAQLVYQCQEFLPEVESGELDVEVGYYKERPMIVFHLPVINDTSTHVLVLGVTINEKGELVYNFVEGNKTQVI